MIKHYYIATDEREDMQFIGHPAECEFNDKQVRGIYKAPDGKFYARMQDNFFMQILVYDYIGEYTDTERNLDLTYVLMDRDNEYHTGLFNATHECFIDCTTGEVLWEMEDARYHMVVTWLAGRQVIVLPIIS